MITPSNRMLRLTGLAAVIAIAIAACSGSASLPIAGGSDGQGASVGAPVAAPDAPADRSDTDVTAREAGDDTANGPGGTSSEFSVVTGPLIVRTGTLSLEVTELDATLLRARAAINGLGGYVSDSQRTNAAGEALAAITYRIPVDRWDDALDALKDLSTRLVTEDTRAVEVTGQVVDLDARIANLGATERALQGIMAKATRISDVLEVQGQLTAVQGEIERLTAQRAHLADQAAFASMTVTWMVPLVAVTEATQGWSLSVELDRALAALLQVGQGLAVIGLWLLVVGLPVVAGIAFVIALVMLTARRLGLVRRQAV